MTVYLWSQTAANNDDIDSTINYQEGQSPGSLNNSGRAVMAAIAKWRDDQSGMLNSGGTDTAYTVTTNQVYTALTDGITVTMRMHATSGASPTLAPDGLTAKAITTDGTTAVPTGALVSGGVYKFTYDAGTDKWIVIDFDNNSYRPGGTDVAVADGGTGASDAAGARAALGVAFEHISSVTASAASNIDFSLPAGYDYFTIKTNNITSSDNNMYIRIRFSQSSTFLSGASDYRTAVIHAVYSGADFYGAIDDTIFMGDAIGNGSIEKSFFELELQRPLDSGNYINMFYKIGFVLSDGAASYNKGWGRLVKNTNAIDGIRIFPTSGTLTGQFDLFGLKAS